MHEEYDCTAREGRGSVAPITQGTGWDGADQEIANDAASQCRGEREHHKAQKIEISRDGGSGALDTEQERPGQIDCEEKFVRVVFHEAGTGFYQSRAKPAGAIIRCRNLASCAHPTGRGVRV